MTEQEMVKAMEICKDKEIPCDDCPLVECGDCEGISRQYFYDRFKQLQSENAELKSSLTHANEECLKWHERAQNLLKDSGGSISGYEKKISALQAENAALREQISKMITPPCTLGDTLYITSFCFGDGYDEAGNVVHTSGWQISETKVDEKNFYRMCDLVRNGKALFSREAAEARLAELKGGNNAE